MKLKTIIKKNNNKNISEVVARLKAGEVIGLPTETVYGLAGRCDNKNTIENIYKIKIIKQCFKNVKHAKIIHFFTFL